MRTALPPLFAVALAAVLPAQGVRATQTRVDVAIVDGIATVELALGLRNDGARIGEADWVLPLPEGAVADGFTTRIGDQKPIRGEVLDANRARQVYESIVRRRRDPGLLEYSGRGCLRARLFPIPPGEDAEVRIRWRQVLPELGGLVRWSHPVAGTGIDGRPPESVTFAVKVQSSTPIRTVLSPTPGAEALVIDEHHAVASFEPAPGQALPKELALYYGLSEEAFGLHLLAQRIDAQKDGHFALLVSPKRDWDDADVPPRAVTFVLDVSGSMKGQKIEQAKGALRQFLNGLRPVDRFDVVPFSTAPEPFFGAPVEASAENVHKALQRVDGLEARGGTNLEGALTQGLPKTDAGSDAVPMCVLLSDGLPTVGQTDVTALRELAKKLVTERDARVFVLGVGHDVHTVLLDDIVEAGRGIRQYVRPDEDIEEKASDLLVKIGRPVLTDLELVIDGAEVSRMSPNRLPDLFAGSRLVVTGRYAKPGQHAVRLRGRVGDVEREYVFDAAFPATETTNDFVPKLWATRRVATLLDEIRRNGQHAELLEEVRALGTEFQIVTPYTSHLVVEEALGVRLPPVVPNPGGGGGRPGTGGPASPGPAGPATPGPAGPATGGGFGRYHGPGDAIPPNAGGGARTATPNLTALGAKLQSAGVLPKDAKPAEVEKLARQVAREMQQSAQGLSALGKQASGARAVDDSVYLARLLGTASGSDQFFMGSRAADPAARIARLFVRKVDERVFRLREGIWTDATYDPEKPPAESIRVVAFSDEYFELLREHPELAKYAALSDRMKIVLGDTLVEITPAPEPEGADEEKPPAEQRDG